MGGTPFLMGLLSRLAPGHTWLKAHTFLLTYLSYMAYHASRKPISVVKTSEAFFDCDNDEEDSTHISNDTTCLSWITEIDGQPSTEANILLGSLDSTFLFAYAGGIFVSGFVAERVNLRYFLLAGHLVSGGLAILYGLAKSLEVHSLAFFVSVLVAQGLCQSTGWPGLVPIMGNWFGKSKRGLIMGVWNTHTYVGNIVGTMMAAAFVNQNWGLSFIVPGILMAGVGVLIFLFLVPSPGDMEMMQNAKSEEEKAEAGMTKEKEGQEEKAISLLGALRIPGVVEFSLCLFFSKLVSYTFLYWLPKYIYDESGMDPSQAATLSTLFDYGGIVGGIAAGLLTDKTGMSATTCTLMLLVAIPFLFLYTTLVESLCPFSIFLPAQDDDSLALAGYPVHDSCYRWNCVVLFAVGVLVNGPYALITTAVSIGLGQHPSLKGSSKATATVTAIIDGTGSIGAAVGPFLAGALSDNNRNVFYMLMGSDLAAMLLLSRLTINEIRALRASKAKA